jgi:hypothetical protein
MSDLVKRLRQEADSVLGKPLCDGGHLFKEAAERIAELESERSKIFTRWRNAEAALERVRVWLDNNTTFCAEGKVVLTHVSQRIWYHATDDTDSWPFTALMDRELAAALKEEKK